MKIAAIPRNASDSPNMSEHDRAILLAVAEKLKSKGHSVDILNDDESNIPDGYDALYHMSRTGSVLSGIRKMGEKAMNSVASVENCSRKRFMQLLSDAGASQPPFCITETEGGIPAIDYPMWLKNAEGWSAHPKDVQYITNESEAQEALHDYRARGHKEIICCRHTKGDIVKFYGVKGRFFHWQYPDPQKSKFGLEKINGATSHNPFDENALRINAQKAADAIGLEIYGGDAIITKEGEIFIIDINDFPSFSCCREAASEAISEYIISKLRV